VEFIARLSFFLAQSAQLKMFALSSMWMKKAFVGMRRMMFGLILRLLKGFLRFLKRKQTLTISGISVALDSGPLLAMVLLTLISLLYQTHSLAAYKSWPILA